MQSRQDASRFPHPGTGRKPGGASGLWAAPGYSPRTLLVEDSRRHAHRERLFGRASRRAAGWRDVAVVATDRHFYVVLAGDQVVGWVEPPPAVRWGERLDPGVGGRCSTGRSRSW